MVDWLNMNTEIENVWIVMFDAASCPVETIFNLYKEFQDQNLMLGSNACFGIMYFVPLCYIQIEAALDVSPLIYVASRFCHLI